jgi:phosphatidate cytidylyltransferase
MSNMATRVVVAVVAIPIIFYATYVGGYLFYFLILVMSSIALSEFYSLSERKGASPLRILGILTGILMVSVFFYGKIFEAAISLLQRVSSSVRSPSQLQWLLILLIAFVLVSLTIELFRGKSSPLFNLASTAFGMLYVSMSFGTFIGIRELFHNDFPLPRFLSVVGVQSAEVARELSYRWGGYTVISILACIWICDTAAQFVGLKYGKHKLFPRVSPNKSWEGAVSGFVAAIGAAVLARYLVLPFFSLGESIVIGFVVGVFGQLGDLAESLLKRDAGVKDSSAIIPGHGGMLDRFDSLLFVSPVLYLYFDFILF